MNDEISFQANPETRGTVPVQFFEADTSDVPAGTKATPRPVNRPRELPPAGPAVDALQTFESQETTEAQDTKATPRSTSRESS